jgi:nucleotide-binding universal stress UspA family protein
MAKEVEAHRKALEERGESSSKERRRRRGERISPSRPGPERPSEALAEVAENENVRFLVVGTYGKSPLRSSILGSVPHKLLQISRVPVLCVREE